MQKLKNNEFSVLSWGKRAAHNRAQIVYYMAENLEIRRDEIAGRIHLMTGRKLEDCLSEVDLSIQRLFHWGAYCDKYGGGVQVRHAFQCFHVMCTINSKQFFICLQYMYYENYLENLYIHRNKF